jgi:hypothetical protein
MPTVNIYSERSSANSALMNSVSAIRRKVAEVLSGKSRTLISDEISVRLVDCVGRGMLAPIEVEISAQNYPERALHADKICLDMRAYIEHLMPEVVGVRVWLQLVEFGHSWTEEEIASLHAKTATEGTA